MINTEKIEIEGIRADFPIFKTKIRGKKLVYLDNAASTHKPSVVLESMRDFYENHYSNIHRGVYQLSMEATDAYEKSREGVAKFLNANSPKEVIFTKGTTEGMNLIASSWGGANLKEGDEIILSIMEHHAVVVPWKMIADAKGAVIKVVPLLKDGSLDLEAYKQLLSNKTKVVSIIHISNALGTINPVEEISKLAKSVGAIVVIDGAQALQHMQVDVQKIGCDFYVFGGHKLYGPTGIGVVWGKSEILNNMPPYQGGGDMILKVSFDKITYRAAPERFEAGTPPIAEAVGLLRAIEYILSIGYDKIGHHEKMLSKYMHDEVRKLTELEIKGNPLEKVGILSFTLNKIHPHDIASMLDYYYGVAIRAGHHCAQPLMEYLGLPATSRASIGVYNTAEDIDIFINGLKKVIEHFK